MIHWDDQSVLVAPSNKVHIASLTLGLTQHVKISNDLTVQVHIFTITNSKKKASLRLKIHLLVIYPVSPFARYSLAFPNDNSLTPIVTDTNQKLLKEQTITRTHL